MIYVKSEKDFIAVKAERGEKNEHNEHYFQTPDEIIDFLKTVCKFDFNMDMRRGRAVVDAKSLLGIMNLGLNNVIELQMYADDCTELERQLERFAA